MISPEQLRDGIFVMNTIRFGKVAEIMINCLYNLDKRLNQHHDFYDAKNQQRLEVKFSRAQQELPGITADNLLESIKSESGADRRITFDHWKNHSFGCNIQQVKRNEFDVLYYGIFFDDCVKIFSIKSSEIDSSIGYSDKQHKGNKGEGQFFLNNKTLQFHLDALLQR